MASATTSTTETMATVRADLTCRKVVVASRPLYYQCRPHAQCAARTLNLNVLNGATPFSKLRA